MHMKDILFLVRFIHAYTPYCLVKGTESNASFKIITLMYLRKSI